jgi:chaperonin GroES
MSNEQLAKPLGDRVLIEVEVKEKTVGGIIIPDTVRDGENQIGVVVSVGSGIYTQSGTKIPMEVEVGDKVMLPAGGMSLRKIKLGDKEYYLCREMDLEMIIK